MRPALADGCEAEQHSADLVVSVEWASTPLAVGIQIPLALATEVKVQMSSVRQDNYLSLQDTAIDGLCQALILAGALERVPMASEVLCYEAPTYYGMPVAWFSRSDG